MIKSEVETFTGLWEAGLGIPYPVTNTPDVPELHQIESLGLLRNKNKKQHSESAQLGGAIFRIRTTEGSCKHL
jgi:hypothetical protein